MFKDTGFEIKDGKYSILTGWIEWGTELGDDEVYFNHPMTGQSTHNPLQGWADPPGEDAHAQMAAALRAIDDYDMFLEDHAGYERVVWLFDGDRIRMIEKIEEKENHG